MADPRIALVSREVAPLAPGGIGAFVAATASVLAPVAEVTIFTTARHRRGYEMLAAAAGQVGEPGGAGHGAVGLPPARFVFVPEPRGFELGGFRSRMHAWSARLYEAIRETYGEDGPDLVEFQDFLGEGGVAVQARRTLSPGIGRTTVCVRVNTTSEIVRVLDGAFPSAFEERLTFALERQALARCDHVLWAGGAILDAYRRFYRDALAAPLRIRQAFAFDAPQPPPPLVAPGERPLRLLYLGRLERRKGVRNLVEAVSGLDRDDVELTIAGADTETAPLGGSMRSLLELETGGDPRVRLRDPVGRDDVAELISAHDALVIPSLWECWPNVALEALERNRPLIATPTGGLVELVRTGRSGWLAPGVAAADLAATIEHVLDRRSELFGSIESGGPRSLYEELTDPDEIRSAYVELCGESRSGRPPARPKDPPLVSIVIPYFRLPAFVEETAASAAAQTHPRTEILLVNDGSFDPEDEAALGRIADRYPVEVLTQRNCGLGAARNFGIGQARGEYVFPLDADNVAHPDFVARCLEVLEATPELAYVNSWSRYIDERGEPWRGLDDGERPLGNASPLLEEANLAGDAAAVIRRSVFDAGHRYDPELTSYEDWSFYRVLRGAGLRGETIPEPLISYRVRGDSMARRVGEPNRERLLEELAARDRERAMRWTAPGEGEPAPATAAAERERAAAASRLARGRDASAAAAAATRLAGRAAGARGWRPAATIRTALRRPAHRVRNSARRVVLRLLR